MAGIHGVKEPRQSLTVRETTICNYENPSPLWRINLLACLHQASLHFVVNTVRSLHYFLYHTECFENNRFLLYIAQIYF